MSDETLSAEKEPSPVYRLMKSNIEALAAIELVIQGAQREIRIFDATPRTLRDRDFGNPSRIEALRKLLLAAMIAVVGGLAVAAELKSGPQTGEKLPGPFHPLNVNGVTI